MGLGEGTVVVAHPAVGRPTRALPAAQIFQLSAYWFAISAIWGTVTLFLQRRMEDLVPKDITGTAYGAIIVAGAAIAILVQPTVGAISDYTVSRWGRRKPYIAVGAILDVVFLLGLATSHTYLSIFAFVCLLQLSSNLAQGPFQGYMPDLVPAQQVSLASAVFGVMNVIGKIVGIILASIGLAQGDFTLSLIGVGILELALALGTIAWVHEGRGAPSREGRSWVQVARSAWGLDILRERSFLWLLASRLFLLMPLVGLLEFENFFLQRSLGLSDQEAGFWNSAAGVAIGASYLAVSYPASRLSDRFGRKAVIYASAAIGAVGLLGTVLAPTPLVATGFVVVLGIGGGSFFAVDWALMTDIIPKAASGRYMGISNVVTAGAGPVSAAIQGVVMDRVGLLNFGAGPRAALAIGLLFLALAALFLRPVDERRREE